MSFNAVPETAHPPFLARTNDALLHAIWVRGSLRTKAEAGDTAYADASMSKVLPVEGARSILLVPG